MGWILRHHQSISLCIGKGMLEFYLESVGRATVLKSKQTYSGDIGGVQHYKIHKSEGLGRILFEKNKEFKGGRNNKASIKVQFRTDSHRFCDNVDAVRHTDNWLFPYL